MLNEASYNGLTQFKNNDNNIKLYGYINYDY